MLLKRQQRVASFPEQGGNILFFEIHSRFTTEVVNNSKVNICLGKFLKIKYISQYFRSRMTPSRDKQSGKGFIKELDTEFF